MQPNITTYCLLLFFIVSFIQAHKSFVERDQNCGKRSLWKEICILNWIKGWVILFAVDHLYYSKLSKGKKSIRTGRTYLLTARARIQAKLIKGGLVWSCIIRERIIILWPEQMQYQQCPSRTGYKYEDLVYFDSII